MSPQRRENSFLAPLLDLAAAVDDEGHFLAVFHRLDGRTFGGGFDVSDLRITSGFKLGYKLLLGQGIGRREDANHQQTINDRLGDCSRRHDLCSWLVRTAETYSETSTPIRHGGSALEAGIASHLGREAAIGHTMGARLERILIPIGFCFGDERFRTAHDKFPAGKCRARSARTCEAHARTVSERANLLLKIGASDPGRPIAPLAFATGPD